MARDECVYWHKDCRWWASFKFRAHKSHLPIRFCEAKKSAMSGGESERANQIKTFCLWSTKICAFYEGEVKNGLRNVFTDLLWLGYAGSPCLNVARCLEPRISWMLRICYALWSFGHVKHEAGAGRCSSRIYLCYIYLHTITLSS